MRWWSSELRDRIQRAAGPDARAQILAMFYVMHEIMHDPEYHGCIFINAAVEFPQPHHPAHQSARQAKADGIALLADLAERAGASDPAISLRFQLKIRLRFNIQLWTRYAERQQPFRCNTCRHHGHYL